MAGAGAGSGLVPLRGVVVLVVALFGLAAIEIYAVVAFWPPEVSEDPVPAANFFGASIALSRDTRFFWIVVAAGALGGTIHAIRSLGWYVGNRNLRQSWVLRYLLLPAVGALLAFVLYLLLRAGLVSGPGSSDASSAFGFAAVSALVGLFSDQAVEKLKQVFETLLTPVPPAADHGATETLSIASFRPMRGGPGTEVHIQGVGLAAVTSVAFGGESAVIQAASDGELTVLVPDGAVSGPIAVATPSESAETSASFAVDERA
jgi:IPT/TIG domain